MSTAVMVTKGNLGVGRCLSIFWLFLSCATDCLWKHSAVPKSLQEEGQAPLYFIKFLLSSFISVWYLPSEIWAAFSRCAHRRVFVLVWEQQHPPGDGGVCHQRTPASPIILTVSKWLRGQWVRVNTHPILSVSDKTICLPNSMVWIS